MNDETAAIGSLSVSQSQIDSDWTPTRQYDFVVSCLSWEERCTTTLNIYGPNSKEIQLIKFQSNNTATNALKDSKLKQFQETHPNAKLINLHPSTELQDNFKILEEWIKDRYIQNGRPLRLLIDITCMPKTYLLFLLGLGFTRDYLTCYDCIYAQGQYDLTSDPEDMDPMTTGPRSLISEGHWTSQQVPYLTADQYLPPSRDLVVTMGGEIGLSLQFIERIEPRRLKIIFIEETAPSDDVPMHRRERYALNDLMNEPNAERTDIGIGDIIQTANSTIQFARNAGISGITAVAVGTKTHALGLGIAALAEKNIEVICRTPIAYKPINVKPSGKIYLFEIHDRFDPLSYLF